MSLREAWVALAVLALLTACGDESSSSGGGGSGATATGTGTGGLGGGGSAGTGGSGVGGDGAGGQGGSGLPPSACLQGATYYLSLSGSDASDGTSEASAWASFEHAYAAMAAGDQLLVLDGSYPSIGDASTPPPSGEGVAKMTCVRAANPGGVQIDGTLSVGTASDKQSFVLYEGMTFHGGAGVYNSDHLVVKSCGFHSETQSAGGVFGVGTNDGEWGNTNLLAEDIWVWGKERVGLIIYRSDHVVVRRAVVRLDGCDSHASGCGDNSGNSMVGTTIYNSHHVAFENLLVLDGLLGPGGYGGAADLQTAWHDNFIYPFGANSWLGVMSIGSELGGMYPEIDGNVGESHQPFFTFRDVVLVNPAGGGVSAQSQGSLAGTSMTIDNLTVFNSEVSVDAVRVGPEYDGMVDSRLRNVVAVGTGRFGINSAITPEYADVAGSWTDGDYNQTSCSTGCLTSDPLSGGSPAILHLPRVEAGSALAGAGADGADIGANVLTRYGADGTFYGDANFDALTATPLWPWPNQARIQAEMCDGVTRGFCAAPNVSRYVWEYLGAPCPANTCE
jgi:hypothetical protein